MGKIAQEKHTLLNALVMDNIKPGVIAQTLNYTPEHTSRLIAKSKAFQLVTTKRVKKATQAVDYLSNVENYQGDRRIKPSDMLSAAKTILDRSHPVVQQIQSQSVSVVINQEVTEGMRDSLIRQGLIEG